jgi:phosphoglycolate phosphatase-like HAD superfamily hydrolase
MIRRLVLFDIDGTLLSSASAGRRAIRRAFADEFEKLEFFDQVRFDGKTDPQIITELYHAAGAPDLASEQRIAALLERYIGHLPLALHERAEHVRVLPGITELLEALHQRSDVIIGLLTGNVVPGAQLKLGAAGIPFDRFRVGAFGSDSAFRPDLPSIAAERAVPWFGRRPHGEEVVIIGDTPADVTCGASIGARAIAVATGSYSTEELLAAGAASAFATLADTAAVLAAIR